MAEQEKNNKEPYVLVATTFCRHPAFFEGHLHRYLHQNRVTKLKADGTPTDGGTEWFVVRQRCLKEAMVVLRLLQAYVWSDTLPRTQVLNRLVR